MSNKIALFDMDGTLAGYHERLKRDMEFLAGPAEKITDFIDPSEPHLINRTRLIKSSKDWWFNLPPLENGFKVLNIAKEIGFKIHILTKGPRNTPQAWSEKLLWCQKHISEDVDVTITQDKSIVYGRVLVDDFPGYMERWLQHRPRSLGIMPLMDYNKDFHHPNLVKYDGSDFTQIKLKLQEAFDRK